MDPLLKKIEQEYFNKLDCKLNYLLEDYTISEMVEYLVRWTKMDWKKTDPINYNDIITLARDFYIGSDLSEKQKKQFYNELKKQGFFDLLKENLYSQDFVKSNCTIYTIGKFSEPENIPILEKAYEDYYTLSNPILIQKALFELSWLGSKKLKTYLKNLEDQEDLVSKLTLLLYWEHTCNSKKINTMISDSDLMAFIFPNFKGKITEDLLSEKLIHFENDMNLFFYKNENLTLTKSEFLEKAKVFFQNKENLNS